MKFIVPAEGRISSGFRTKERPDHHGIDIAKPGTVEILAAAAGVVSKSYESASYGQVIFIKHLIDGQEYETVYAHLRDGSRLVQAGAKVKQGQKIGYMGNTGHSFGQHLHFELHKGTWNINKTQAVDPEKYIGKEDPKPQSKPVAKPTTTGTIKVVGKIKIANLKAFTYIYAKPSDKSAQLGQAKLGAIFPIAGSVPGWFEVIYKGERAYVKAKYATKL